MLFTCSPRSSCAAVRTADRKVIKRKNTSLAVDLHCHVHTPEADEIAKQTQTSEPDAITRHGSQRTADRQKALRHELDAKLTSVKQRLKDMDRMGIDVQAISTSPMQYYYRLEPELGQQTSRKINENLATIVAGNPDRFVGLGTIPMQEPSYAEKELEYCINELGFRGVEIGTNVRKGEISDDRFKGFWAKAEKLGAVVFLHPAGFTDTSRMKEHFLTNVIGNPLDTTFAIAHLVYGGVLERHPKLKIVAAHGGGYMGHYPARMDHAYRVRPECHDFIKRPPSHYMKKIYYDTMVFSHTQLEHLVNLYGADHVVIGTDYPYDMGYYKPVDFVNGANLTKQQKSQIIGENAAKILGLRPRK